ncbi:MAG: DUF11 domain-containing protein [Chloroflexi bacterium]|nr:DUF11 domain-containing protein [Chloroflexota bacterium]
MSVGPARAEPSSFQVDPSLSLTQPEPQGSPPLPDLSLNMIGPSILIPESVITYTINYANFGQDVAPSVVLTDILPNGITFGGAIPLPMTRTGQTLVFGLGDLNQGVAGTILMTGTVGSNLATGTTLTNTAVISSPVQESDIDNNIGWVVGTVQRADLEINLSGPASTNPGQELDLTLNYANIGGAPAPNPQLTVTLPAGFTFGGPHSGSAQVLGSQIIFRPGTLAAGIARSIDITGTIDATLADNTVLTFTAIASVSAQEDSLANNQSTYAIAIQRADVQISINGPGGMLPGSTVTYTLSYTNTGSGLARDVVVTDYLSSLVTYQGSTSIPSREPPESGDGNSRVWEIGILGPNASGIIVITGTLAPALAPATPITNSAAISTSTPEINGNNNTAGQTGFIVYADVTGSFSLPGGPGQVYAAIPGQNFSVGISYRNQGGAPAENTRLTITLPPLVSYQTDNSPWGPPTPSGGNTLTWQPGTLPPQSQGIFTATFSLAPVAPIASQLTFTGSINTTTQDFVPGNNSWLSAPVLVTAAEMVLTKTGPALVAPGEYVSYILTVRNTGNLTAANVTVTDTLPVSLTLTGAIPVRTGGTLQQPVWQLGNISPGGSMQIQIGATLSPDQPSRTTVTNMASVGTVTTESSLANNTASTNFTVAPGAPALVQLAVQPTSLLVGGETAAITVTVKDRWGTPVTDGTEVFFTAMRLGSFASGVARTSNGVATNILTTGIRPGTETLTVASGSVSTGQVIQIRPGPPGSISLSFRGQTGNPDAPTVEDAVVVTAVVLDVYGNTVADGTPVNFSTNLGQITPGTVLTNRGIVTTILSSQISGNANVLAQTAGRQASIAVSFLPAPPARVSLSADNPNIPVEYGQTILRAVVTDRFGNLVLDGQTVAFTTTLGTLSTTSATTVHGVALSQVTASRTPGQANLQASVGGSAFATATVFFQPSDPGINMTVTPIAAVLPGDNLTYVLQFSNLGIARARNVEIDDALPTGLINPTWVSSGVPVTFTGSSRILSWDVGDLESGASGTITITTQVDPERHWPYSQSIFNQATVSTSTADGHPENNQALRQALVITSDVFVLKNVDLPSSTPEPGGLLVYRISFGNLGQAVPTSILITDTIPTYTEYQSDNSEALGFTFQRSEGQLTWSRIGPVSSAEQFNLFLRVKSDAPGGIVLTNRISTSTNLPESDTGNNSDSEPVTLNGINLGVGLNGPTGAGVGYPVTYTIDYSNSGTQMAPGTGLTLTIPAGLSLTGFDPPPALSIPGGQVWQLGSLSAGVGGTIRITGSVDNSTPIDSELHLSTEIGTSGPESFMEDNAAALTTRIFNGYPAILQFDVPQTVFPTDFEGITGNSIPVTVTVRDPGGNPVADGLQVTLTSTIGTVTPTLATTVNGIVTGWFYPGHIPGEGKITAQTAEAPFAPPLYAEYTVRVVPGSLSQIDITSQYDELTVDQTTVITVTARDRFGNLQILPLPVTFGANLGYLQPLDGILDHGQVTTTLGSVRPGISLVTVSFGPTVTRNISITFEPGQPSAISIDANPRTVITGGMPVTITGIVVDQFFNRVEDGTLVTISTNLGDLGCIAAPQGRVLAGSGREPCPQGTTATQTMTATTDSGNVVSYLYSGDTPGKALVEMRAGQARSTIEITFAGVDSPPPPPPTYYVYIPWVFRPPSENVEPAPTPTETSNRH